MKKKKPNRGRHLWKSSGPLPPPPNHSNPTDRNTVNNAKIYENYTVEIKEIFYRFNPTRPPNFDTVWSLKRQKCQSFHNDIIKIYLIKVLWKKRQKKLERRDMKGVDLACLARNFKANFLVFRTEAGGGVGFGDVVSYSVRFAN